MNTNYLTRPQAAEYLNLKKSTLDAWAVRGNGPAFCKFGRAVRYRRQDLDAYAEEHLVTSTSQRRRA